MVRARAPRGDGPPGRLEEAPRVREAPPDPRAAHRPDVRGALGLREADHGHQVHHLAALQPDQVVPRRVAPDPCLLHPLGGRGPCQGHGAPRQGPRVRLRLRQLRPRVAWAGAGARGGEGHRDSVQERRVGVPPEHPPDAALDGGVPREAVRRFGQRARGLPHVPLGGARQAAHQHPAGVREADQRTARGPAGQPAQELAPLLRRLLRELRQAGGAQEHHLRPLPLPLGRHRTQEVRAPGLEPRLPLQLRRPHELRAGGHELPRGQPQGAVGRPALHLRGDHVRRARDRLLRPPPRRQLPHGLHARRVARGLRHLPRLPHAVKRGQHQGHPGAHRRGLPAGVPHGLWAAPQRRNRVPAHAGRHHVQQYQGAAAAWVGHGRRTERHGEGQEHARRHHGEAARQLRDARDPRAGRGAHALYQRLPPGDRAHAGAVHRDPPLSRRARPRAQGRPPDLRAHGGAHDGAGRQRAPGGVGEVRLPLEADARVVGHGPARAAQAALRLDGRHGAAQVDVAVRALQPAVIPHGCHADDGAQERLAPR
mmetsp:Transcript_66859/g.164841  ORF Transcript_66859/g.164841 Transcript_66859/m.164841 type:complete len:539 (+) Transcript_66859:4843-6459(+)